MDEEGGNKKKKRQPHISKYDGQFCHPPRRRYVQIHLYIAVNFNLDQAFKFRWNQKIASVKYQH